MYGTARFQSMRSLLGSPCGVETNQSLRRCTSERRAGFFMFMNELEENDSKTHIVYVVKRVKSTNFPIIGTFRKRNQCRNLGRFSLLRSVPLGGRSDGEHRESRSIAVIVCQNESSAANTSPQRG